MIIPSRSSLTRALLVSAVPGFALLVSACASISESPFRDDFNSALDNCEIMENKHQRQGCFGDAMQSYTEKYENWRARQPG